MRISQALKSLEHGVSTDTSTRRHPKYLAEQENLQTVAGDGLHKRQGTDIVKLEADNWMASNPFATPAGKEFKMLDDTYFLLTMQAVGMQMVVLDLAGNSMPLTIEAGTNIDYFRNDSGAPLTNISTNGDTAYLTNPNYTVRNTGLVRGTNRSSMIRILRAPAQGTTLAITYTDKLAVTRTVTHVVGATTALQGTNIIAGVMASAIVAQAPSGITALAKGSTIILSRSDGIFSDANTEDDEGNQILEAINGTVDTVLKLPKYVAGETILEIKPDTNTDRGTFYMQSVVTSEGSPALGGLVDTVVSAGEYHTASNDYDGFSSHTGIVAHGSNAPAVVINTRTVDEITIHTDNTTGSQTLRIKALNDFLLNSDITWVTIQRNGFNLIDSAVTPVNIAAGKWYFTAPALSGQMIGGTDYDIFFNQPSAIAASLDEIRWEETSKPLETFELHAGSMPHLLTRKGEGSSATFTLSTVDWDEKRAGDNTTNPDPYFVGRQITNTGIFQNRLVAIVGDQFVTTETDNLFSWYRNTVTQLLATHPVRLRSTVPNAGKFHSLVNHNQDLVLFTQDKQFKLPGNLPLTPKSSGLPLASTYTSIPSATPLSLGNNIYFPFSYGKTTGLSKYKSDANADLADRAQSVTEHVKKYIADIPTDLVGDANLGVIYSINKDSGVIYVCDYDEEKSDTPQRDERFAWSRWTPEPQGNILATTLVDGVLYFITQRAQNYIDMLKLDTVESPDLVDGAFKLDRKLDILTTGGGTTITVPTGYSLLTGEPFRVSIPDRTHVLYGAALQNTTDGVSTITLDPPIGTDEIVTIGNEYKATVTPSTLYVRDESGKVNSQTKLRIQRFIVMVNDSADITATINSDYYTIPDQYWSGLIVGDIDSVVGEVANETNRFVVGYRQRNDLASLQLHSSSHLPMHISQIDYVGSYTSRGKRF